MRLIYLLTVCAVFASPAFAGSNPVRVLADDKVGTVANDMNSAGQVAGATFDDSGHRFAIFLENGKMTRIGYSGSSESDARGINEQGVVVGSTSMEDGRWRAFMYSKEKGTEILGTLGGRSSNAAAINDHGAIVGYSDTVDDEWHAFFWSGQGKFKDLGTLGGKSSYASAINNDNQIVGASLNDAGIKHAFLYQEATGMVDLGTLGGPSSSASSINDKGVIVGSAQTKNGRWHAFIYDGQKMFDLGAIIGRGDSYATGINNAGNVVGTVDIGDSRMGFVWHDHKITLHSGGKGLYIVNGINNNEQVIGATYSQIVAGTFEQSLHAAALPSNAAPFSDQGGQSFIGRSLWVVVIAIVAVIIRRRYRGIRMPSLALRKSF